MTPTANDAATVVRSRLGLEPVEVRRFSTGLCHHVFLVTAAEQQMFVVRIATPETAQLLAGGIYWNQFLRPKGVPLPRMIASSLQSSEIQFPFVILEQIPGTDLGEVYPTLSSQDKVQIVGELLRVQKRVALLPEAAGFGFAYSYSEPPGYRGWEEAILVILERAQQRMLWSGHPGSSYVGRARQIISRYHTYFTAVQPVPFLDDTTTKNVLVDRGRLTGIVDVDQLCFGDPLLTIGLTQTALLATEYDVEYVEHWMDLLKLDGQQRQVVGAYTLLFCVDFMGELGQRFNKDQAPEIDLEKFARLKSIFETLAE
jgi:aminoglycoside phosphotransferase (APT) family kinase protein